RDGRPQYPLWGRGRPPRRRPALPGRPASGRGLASRPPGAVRDRGTPARGRNRRMNGEHPRPAPVAIIGIGCLFPRAKDRAGYWANIQNRVDAITGVPPTHWRPEDYLDCDPKAPDRVYTARGGFLSPVDFPTLEF